MRANQWLRVWPEWMGVHGGCVLPVVGKLGLRRRKRTHGIHVNHCDRDKPPIQGGFCDITINEHPYSGVSSPDAGYAPSADRSLPPMANGN